MAGIRWGKLSGKNRGGTCNGGKGRKCEKSEGAIRGKEGEGMKSRDLLRSRCAKTSVMDGTLIEIRSSPALNSNSLQEEGAKRKTDSCEINGKFGKVLHKEVAIKKTDICDKSFDASLNKTKSKSNLIDRRVGNFKKLGPSVQGVDTECKEKLANGSIKSKGNWSVKQGMPDKECLENVKQGTWNYTCMEDAKKGKLDSERVEDAIQHMWGNEQTHMLHVRRNATLVEKLKKGRSCDEAGVAKDTDSKNSVVYDETGDGDCMKVVVHDKVADVNYVSPTQSSATISLCRECLKDFPHKVSKAEVDNNKDFMYEKTLSADSKLVMVPHDFVCGISKKVMEDPVVIASGQTFERVCIQAWLHEGNTLCPVTQKPLSHLQLIPNLTLKALISSWYLQSQDSSVESAHHSFCSCISSFSPCPSLMTSDHQSFVSCSSFSVSKLLEDTELYSSASSSLSSLPKLLVDAELHSFSSSSVSTPSYDTPEHLRVAGIHTFPSPISTGSPSSSWEQGREVFCLQDSTLQSMKLMHKRLEDDEKVMLKALQRCNPDSKSRNLMLQSAKPCAYIVSRIDSLVSDLHSEYLDIQRSAAAELRLLAKHDDRNRMIIASAGALRPLVVLLCSRDESIQLEATTALLNLALNPCLKDSIVKEAGAIEALVCILRDGFNTVAKENAAITLACLATSEENKSKIGLVNAVEPLVNLLERGSSPRGRKDAAAALYRLSSNDENKRRLVRAGASRLLVDFMSKEGDRDGMTDKAMAILGNLVSVEEGRVAFVEEGGILSLMQVLQTASKQSKRLAVPILSHLCAHSSKHRSLVLQNDPLPVLMELSKTGSARFKAQVAEVIQVLIVDAC